MFFSSLNTQWHHRDLLVFVLRERIKAKLIDVSTEHRLSHFSRFLIEVVVLAAFIAWQKQVNHGSLSWPVLVLVKEAPWFNWFSIKTRAPLNLFTIFLLHWFCPFHYLHNQQILLRPLLCHFHFNRKLKFILQTNFVRNETKLKLTQVKLSVLSSDIFQLNETTKSRGVDHHHILNYASAL